MSEAAEESPNWNLLPHRPVEFFGLEPDFDRKDLKRAYNRWLKVYKPDKHPDEFQKLRAAYEQLDSGLRYGRDTTPAVNPTLGWANTIRELTSPEPVNPVTRDAAEASTSQQKPEPKPILSPLAKLEAQLASHAPGEVYQWLKKQGTGAPFDYYALAILSDAEHTPQELMFFKWILTGLKKHPHDATLQRLLHSYLQSDQIPDAELAKVLVNVSRVITTDRFYYYTERLFDRLCDAVAWPQFQKVLDECARNINDHVIRGRIVFLCHILRRASWKAPLEAVEKILAELDQNAEFLSGMLEYEFEFNTRLVDYVRTREAFIRRGPTCAMIDEALRISCVEPGDASDARVVACQTHISQNPERLFAELPFLGPDNDIHIACWLWMCDEVQDRLETESQAIGYEHANQVVMKLLQQIDTQFPSSPLQFYNLMRLFVAFAGYGLAFFIPMFFTSFAEMLPKPHSEMVSILLVILAIGMVIAFHLVIKPRTTDHWMGLYLYKLVCRHYREWWRPMIARFHAATHLSFLDVRHSASYLVSNHHEGLNVSTWLPQLYGQDLAMVLYASSVRFLR